ncbi:DUF1292 domain-containing protein [Hydrogenibacillus sp. N12]|uniref:DUF1292 domain-containing protein n=1 Tax=Hydrogenibacillus sp. N12 TaxID=2866627 RepID=UPI001C7DF78B|nr:DUF1292 domain-containing protein [Hydrogenibacillus sp. N12]
MTDHRDEHEHAHAHGRDHAHDHGHDHAHDHPHDHDHDHDPEFDLDFDDIEENIIYIADEDGNEQAYEILTEIDDEDSGKRYILVSALDDGEDDGDEEADEVLAFRYEEDEEGGMTLYPIETDEEWALVEEAFQTLVDEGQV